MCTKNYILLNRNLLVNDLWNSEPFTRGQAWVDLLLNTNWKDSTAIIKGVSVPVKRGQVCRSIKQLAIRWKWSEGKVKRYLELLVSLQQITYEIWNKNGAVNGEVNGAAKSGVTTLITIVNYNSYQIDGAVNGAVDEAKTERRRSADGAQTETYKKGNKDKEQTTNPVVVSIFEELWKAYPADGRVKKKEAVKHYLATVKNEDDMNRINIALGNYLDHLEANEWKKPQNGSTWFNNWQDWEGNHE